MPPEKKPYNPRQNSSVDIHLDLNDFCKKVQKRGALVAIAETVYNLSLLANDHMKLEKGGRHEPAKSNGKS